MLAKNLLAKKQTVKMTHYFGDERFRKNIPTPFARITPKKVLYLAGFRPRAFANRMLYVVAGIWLKIHHFSDTSVYSDVVSPYSGMTKKNARSMDSRIALFRNDAT